MVLETQFLYVVVGCGSGFPDRAAPRVPCTVNNFILVHPFLRPQSRVIETAFVPVHLRIWLGISVEIALIYVDGQPPGPANPRFLRSAKGVTSGPGVANVELTRAAKGIKHKERRILNFGAILSIGYG